MWKWLSAAFVATSLVVPGISSAEDDGTELQYYVMEAKQGSGYAQLTLGEAYFLGEKVEQNLVEAYAWLYVAEQNHIEEAVELMRQVWDAMDRNQRKHAKDLAEYYLEQHGS